MGERAVINAAAVLLLLCSVGLVAEAAPDCSASILSLLPCYPFLTGNVTSPPLTCCVPLAAVVVSQPVCLCEVIGYGNVTLPFQVNSTLAGTLPSLCKVNADQSQCPALVYGAPAGSPVAGLIPSDGSTHKNGASRKIPGTISSILQFAAVPAVASLLLRVYY